MKTAFLFFVTLAVALFGWSHRAYAGVTSVSAVTGTPQITDFGLAGFVTDGGIMDGMTVTAVFDDTSSEVAIWSATGLVSGAAPGTGWSLSQAGDTFTLPWTLTNSSGKGIVELIIDAGAGDSLFDRDIPVGLPGTPGSALGNDFSVDASGDPFDITATYSDIVQVGGAAPIGDLYRRLFVGFVNSGGYTSGADPLLFVQDTDSILELGDLRPVPIPEPTSAMVWLGLSCGLVLARRRRKVEAHRTRPVSD